MSILFQVGALSTFLQGTYESKFTFDALAKKGNTGLGVLNGLDGEMIAVDGHFYRINKKGVARLVTPSDCTPFALVTHFQENKIFELNHVPNIAALNALIDTELPTKNIFYMIRIEAKLAWIKLRSEGCRETPHVPLADILPKIQHSFELTASSGTLIATYCPAYSTGVTIPGYHYHYIDSPRLTGGHVFDLEIISARVSINPIHAFHMTLIDTPYFNNASSDFNIASALKKIE